MTLAGRAISHFQVLEKLGEGGMGVVYKGRDTHLDRYVALKILPPDKVADAERRRRFAQEAKAASALSPPAATGSDVLDPDAEGGPAVDFFPFTSGKRTEILKLGGEPDAFVSTTGRLAVSPDGRWMLYEHKDRDESGIMLVENFR
jgi:serine/threonine protein kinase